MANFDPQAAMQMLNAMLQPWLEAVANPAKTQEEVLHRWLKDYAKTEYGKQHGAANAGIRITGIPKL